MPKATKKSVTKKPAKEAAPTAPRGLLDGLNDEQAAAVLHGEGPLLIVAGAGTGKTTVITRRIAHLVESGTAKPEEILALTFTEKAATEMRERVDLLLPLGYADMWIDTFHGFGKRIIEERGLDIGLTGDSRLLTQTDQWLMLHEHLDELRLKYYRPLGNPARFISQLIRHFSRCKDELISPSDYLEYADSLKMNNDVGSEALIASEEEARIAELANAFHTYQQLLLKSGSMDFADLINYTLELFQKRPRVLEAFQNRFKYILVDEFQDTNFAQYQLVRLLAGPKANLVVVGDDDQSIYKFRGASVSNILKFKEDYPSLRQVTLVKNYRSSQEILDLAYRFIQGNNPDRLEVNLQIDKRLISGTPEVGITEVIEGVDQSDELNQMVKKMVALKAAAPKGTTWNEFGVLLRSNGAATDILPLLQSYGVPHTFVASTGLYKKPLISDILAYLRVVVNPHDSLSCYRALLWKEWRISPQDAALLLQDSIKRTRSLMESLDNVREIPGLTAEAAANVEKFVAALHERSTSAGQHAASEVFVEAVHDLAVERVLEAETLENAENRDLLDQFYKKVERFVTQNTDRGLHRFLHHLDLELEAGDEGAISLDPALGPESVKVMTVHASKGLEFTYVFVPGMVEQRFPTRARNDGLEIPEPLVKDILPSGDFHLQEERRLFYVAATRARRHLYFSWAKDYGGARGKKPSRFLEECGLIPGDKAPVLATGKVVFTPRKKLVEVYQDLPTKFSFSALKAFTTCPLSYKYQYYLKIPTAGGAPLSFGQTIHKVFEQYIKLYQELNTYEQPDLFGGSAAGPKLPDRHILDELYEKHWVDEWYRDKQQKEDYRQRGREMLETFYKRSELVLPKPKYIEKSFRLPLGDYYFTGRIDRADDAPGGVYILDYKTGSTVPKKTEQSDLDQLHIYQWAMEEYFHERVSAMSYWYLCEDTMVEESLASPERLTELKAGFLEIIEKIVHTVRYDLFAEEHEKVKEHKCFYHHN